jgi:hypothetical protein
MELDFMATLARAWAQDHSRHTPKPGNRGYVEHLRLTPPAYRWPGWDFHSPIYPDGQVLAGHYRRVGMG